MIATAFSINGNRPVRVNATASPTRAAAPPRSQQQRRCRDQAEDQIARDAPKAAT
jgi:hypothetical protein